jgi:hypothetical protein
MKATDLIAGLIIGIITALAGTFLFLALFTDFGFVKGISIMRQQGYLGKIITLGSILNLIVFFILLQKKKDGIARGVLLATIILALATIWV